MKKVMIMLSLLLTLGLGAETTDDLTMRECQFSHEIDTKIGLYNYKNDDKDFRIKFIDAGTFLMISYREQQVFKFNYNRKIDGHNVYSSQYGVEIMYIPKANQLVMTGKDGKIAVFGKCVIKG